MTASKSVFAAWQQAMDGLVRGDASVLLDVYSDELEWYDMFFGTLQGGQAVAETLSTLAGKDFDTMDIEVLRVIEADTDGAVEWVQVMRIGERSTRMEGVTILTVNHGRITRWRDYIQPLKNRKP